MSEDPLFGPHERRQLTTEELDARKEPPREFQAPTGPPDPLDVPEGPGRDLLLSALRGLHGTEAWPWARALGTAIASRDVPF